MIDSNVEFKKPIFNNGKKVAERSSVFRLNKSKFHELPIGGYEGKKYFTELSKDHRNVAHEYEFISKVYPSYDKKEVINIIQAYDSLRKKGYIVPNTVRYFEQNDRVYLMMSDMTEGGKYKIWGYSNDMSAQQYEDLKMMNINESELFFIKNKALELANKADSENVNLLTPTYHVRKNMETGEIDIIFLDVDSRVTSPPSFTDLLGRKKAINPAGAMNFISQLSSALRLNELKADIHSLAKKDSLHK